MMHSKLSTLSMVECNDDRSFGTYVLQTILMSIVVFLESGGQVTMILQVALHLTLYLRIIIFLSFNYFINF